VSKALAPEATYPDFQKLLQQYAHCENLLVVGHSPNIQMFLGSLLVPPGAEPKPALIRMRKGSIARVSMSRGPAFLTSLIDPRTVKGLYRTAQATSTKSSRRKTSRK
jgi:phosphohistidine phosphatase